MGKTLYDFWQKHSSLINIHLLCWFIFIVYENSILLVINKQLKEYQSYILFYTLNISLFYIHSLFFLPFILKPDRFKIWKLLLIIIELAIYTGFAVLINFFLWKYLGDSQLQVDFNQGYFAKVLYRGTYFMLFATSYYFFQRYIQKRNDEAYRNIQIEQLNSQLLQSEVDYLRAQINPHLLFNTLLFIQSVAKYEPELVDESILLLSSIMRFAIAENRQEEVLLKEEMVQVENMIRLNQLRFDHRLQIQFDRNVQDSERTILPLVLLTLVENMFKHGALTHKAYPAYIEVEESSEILIYRTGNLIYDNSVFTSNYTGLNNVRSRLENTYPGRYSFIHQAEGGYFKVELKIKF